MNRRSAIKSILAGIGGVFIPWRRRPPVFHEGRNFMMKIGDYKIVPGSWSVSATRDGFSVGCDVVKKKQEIPNA